MPKQNETYMIKLECDKCDTIEEWCITEYHYIMGDYPIECIDCHSGELNITLNNK